jgi:hypothetical protein
MRREALSETAAAALPCCGGCRKILHKSGSNFHFDQL